MTAADILTEAARIVAGTRHDTHGAAERSFGLIAGFWTLYLSHRADPGAPVSGSDVAVMMALLKVARSVCGQAVADHFVDMAGYAGLAGELAGLA